MSKEIREEHIITMDRHLGAATKYISELGKGYRSAEKCNTLLDAALQQVELCCIDLRNLCEKNRPKKITVQSPYFNHKEIYGGVVLMDNGWLDIRLNALLPHCKVLGSTRYVADSITRLLNAFSKNGGNIPLFDNAFMAIVEYCNEDISDVFDQDNKGFKGVINALKGRLFADDNQFELSLGLFTVRDDSDCCHIYVMPADDAGDFLYQLNSGGLFV